MNVASWKLVLECSALRRDASVFLSCLLSVAPLGRLCTPASADYQFVVRFFDRIERGFDYVDTGSFRRGGSDLFNPIGGRVECVEYWRHRTLQYNEYPWFTSLLSMRHACRLPM